MVIRWGVFSATRRTALKTGWLITAGVVALYLGVIQPRDQARGIASQKASGLAAVSGGVSWEPISLWRQTSILPHFRSEAYLQKSLSGDWAFQPGDDSRWSRPDFDDSHWRIRKTLQKVPMRPSSSGGRGRASSLHWLR